MLSAREYVEIMTCKRLNRELPTDKEVNTDEFNELWNKLDNLTGSLSKNTRIKGFSDDDLKGFFAMKVHQTLRRGQFDRKRPPFGFYAKSFNLLLRNINRNVNNAEKKLHSQPDLLDLITDSDIFDGF